MKQNTDQLRYFSRELIREFGFLDNHNAYELNFAQVHLLLECERYGSIDQQTLAKNLRVNKSYVSRLVKKLLNMSLVNQVENPHDNRSKLIILTKEGEQCVEKINHIAQSQVLSALEYLTEAEQHKVKEGLQLYSHALKKARQLSGIIIRPIEKKDNPSLSVLIKKVLTEFGANRPGFAFTDPETNNMFEAYQGEGIAYFVAEEHGLLIGGMGFGPLTGDVDKVCELRKMYLLKEARGRGLGDELLCLAQKEASKSYTGMYLETLSRMTQAIALYRRHHFESLSTALGDTGHYSCDTWMFKKLEG